MSGPSATDRRPFRATMGASLLLAACTSSAAFVERELGAGPARIDPDRPIVVTEEGDSSIAVTFPVLFGVGTTERNLFGPCGLLAVPLDSASLRRLREADAESFGPPLVGPVAPLRSAEGVVTVEERGVQMTRVTRRVSTDAFGPVGGPRGRVLYVEVGSSADSAQALTCPDLTTLAGDDARRRYLVRLDEVQAVEGSAVALAGVVWGAIALSTLLGR